MQSIRVKYSQVASALAANALYKEVFRESVDSDTFELQYLWNISKKQ